MTSDHFLSYWQDQADNQLPLLAQVVQKMVPAEVSGVCFTADPVKKDDRTMVIESVYGLGESLVGGEVSPDRFWCDKKDGSLLEKIINEQLFERIPTRSGVQKKGIGLSRQGKETLDKVQIMKLVEICLAIEDFYQSPQDIEWAYSDGQFHILQSRPITTL